MKPMSKSLLFYVYFVVFFSKAALRFTDLWTTRPCSLSNSCRSMHVLCHWKKNNNNTYLISDVWWIHATWKVAREVFSSKYRTFLVIRGKKLILLKLKIKVSAIYLHQFSFHDIKTAFPSVCFSWFVVKLIRLAHNQLVFSLPEWISE